MIARGCILKLLFFVLKYSNSIQIVTIKKNSNCDYFQRLGKTLNTFNTNYIFVSAMKNHISILK